ncbi:putative aminopeptidase domain protein [Escherichia coli 2-156-04_S4_C3]|nr:putative aminopeptidase domain protein [Escherichia coli 2-156-04_S4_C3]
MPELPRRASPIGYYDSAPGSQNYPYPAMSWLYPDRGDFIAVVGRMQDINAVRQVKAAGDAANLLI